MDNKASLDQQRAKLMFDLLKAIENKDTDLIAVKKKELDLFLEFEEHERLEVSAFGVYSGDKFFKLKLPQREWLVTDLIRERDSVIFIGNEKAGKSLFISQMICSITSQHPFVDKHDIPRPCKVSQVLLEGDLAETQKRYLDMRKVLDFEESLFQLLFLPPLQLHTTSGIDELINQVEEFDPDILILDPVYFAFTGSLSDDKVVREFIGNLRIIQDKLRCALILVHHTHKTKFSDKGKVITEGDEAIFGSKFLKAWPDHTLMLTYDKKNGVRILTCDTQRRGDIQELAKYVLKTPKDYGALFFEEVTENPSRTDVVYNYFCNTTESKTVDQITTDLSFSRNLFYKSVRPLLKDKIVHKDESHRPVKYSLNKGKKGLPN